MEFLPAAPCSVYIEAIGSPARMTFATGCNRGLHMMNLKIVRAGLLMGVAAAAVLPAACNGRNSQSTPPEIPPASTMAIDFSNFMDGRQNQQVLPFANWSWAAGNVGIWNVILTATLAVPVAAFAESFNHEPQLMDDGTWVWSYEVMVGGLAHSARLQAVIVRNQVEWEMFVSQEGSYQEFLWFTGVSNMSRTAGTWTLNKEPADPQDFVLIEWQRDEDDMPAEIKYTNITPQSEDHGSFINYGLVESGTFDAFYDLYGSAENRRIDIEWNRTTKVGRVTDSQHFGDGDWRCWNEELVDTTCGAEPN
jgi:hypothetical protein